MPRNTCIYGKSGSGKTTQLILIARYILDTRPDKTIRIIAADNTTTEMFKDEGMIKDSSGIFYAGERVELLEISNREKALADIRKLSLGYWPNNGKFGSIPECEIKPDTISAYLVEGITGFCDTWLTHLSSKKEEGAAGFKHGVKLIEDDFYFGGLQEGHYNLVQREFHHVLTKGFHHLPVEFNIWTAMIGAAEEKRTGETQYGPKGAGNAQTPYIPQWFNDVFHLDEREEKQVVGDDTRMVKRKYAYFVEHLDRITSNPYLCKIALPPRFTETVYRTWNTGMIPLTLNKGLDSYLQLIDELRRKKNGE